MFGFVHLVLWIKRNDTPTEFSDVEFVQRCCASCETSDFYAKEVGGKDRFKCTEIVHGIIHHMSFICASGYWGKARCNCYFTRGIICVFSNLLIQRMVSLEICLNRPLSTSESAQAIMLRHHSCMLKTGSKTNASPIWLQLLRQSLHSFYLLAAYASPGSPAV